MTSIQEIIIGARFLWRLPASLRHPIAPEAARQVVRRRLERREADFLALMKRAVYEHEGSPYRPLLRLAGCEYGDLERLVIREGVEGALHVLCRRGVYLTVDEFKGRRPVVRGNMTVAVNPHSFRNPLSAFHVPARTSGSRGGATPVLIDLAFIRDCAVDTCLAMQARGGGAWLKAHWQIPGGGVIARLIEFGSFGAPPVRWFSQVDPGSPGLHPRYRWSGRALRWGSRWAGVPLPSPEHVPLDDPLPIARWMASVLRDGGGPHLFTFASSAVRLCQAAQSAGIDLHGAHFTVVGEPLTEARLAVIGRSGGKAVSRYAIIECSSVGQGCLAPETADEVHLLHDLHAVIQPGPPGLGPAVPATALLLSSLRRTAPYILVNVSMGDRAEMVRRACGCPLDGLGWATHLRAIRSDEKLTAEGMTFLDADLIRVLEEVLPARFGGGPTDYQLVEGEAEEGRSRLRLLVHPAVGPLDADAVKEAFLGAISAGSGVERVMGQVWRDAGLLRVERRAPYTTTSGKILHLHVEDRSVARLRPSPSPDAPRPDLHSC